MKIILASNSKARKKLLEEMESPSVRLFFMFMRMELVLFFFVFATGIIGCTEFNPVTQRQEMVLYSTDREVNIGKNISGQVEKEYELVKNPLVNARINEITRKVVSVVDRQDVAYFVNVIQAKEEEKEEGADINAFALPGGYVYLYDGLVDFTDNDDQLACVIAHEIGHIVAKHSIKKLQAAMGYTLLSIAVIGTGDAEFARGVNYALVNVLLAYSREDEILADKLGVRYAKEAGYDPRAMIDFLEKLREKKRKEPLRAKSVYRTHPYFSERITAIKKELGEPLTIGDYVNIVND
ncbi:MAG: M48 family metallopeptidase [Candidatus Omnitrophota bacterium]